MTEVLLATVDVVSLLKVGVQNLFFFRPVFNGAQILLRIGVEVVTYDGAFANLQRLKQVWVEVFDVHSDAEVLIVRALSIEVAGYLYAFGAGGTGEVVSCRVFYLVLVFGGCGALVSAYCLVAAVKDCVVAHGIIFDDSVFVVVDGVWFLAP